MKTTLRRLAEKCRPTAAEKIRAQRYWARLSKMTFFLTLQLMLLTAVARFFHWPPERLWPLSWFLLCGHLLRFFGRLGDLRGPPDEPPPPLSRAEWRWLALVEIFFGWAGAVVLLQKLTALNPGPLLVGALGLALLGWGLFVGRRRKSFR